MPGAPRPIGSMATSCWRCCCATTRGERVWSVLHEPTPEDEDARRTHRELARLTHERTAHTNRIGSLLVLHNLRPRIIIGGRDWARWWERHGEQVPPELRAEIERESARLALVKQQIKAIEAARRQAAGRRQAAAGGAAGPVARHRAQGRLGAGQGAVRLAALRQPARAGRLPGAGAHALRQRRQPDRARHQQGRQQASAGVAGGARLGLAALAARQRLDPVVQPALRWRQASACAAWASWRWRGAWPSRCGATCSTARSRPGPRSSQPLPEGRPARPDTRLGKERIIMIKGRRARNVRGSLHSDRPNRWGASVTGVCQRALRACSMGCRIDTSGTDRSSSEHWLERSSHPDLGSRSETPAGRRPTITIFVRGP